MNYANIFTCDTNNGDGFRVSLFVSGCTLKCKNCQNKLAQDFNYGKEFTTKTKEDILSYMSKSYIRGFSLLGGEPFDNNEGNELIDLLSSIKNKLPYKTIYCWSGYRYEELIKNKKHLELLKYVDMLRDGRYIEELKNLNQYLGGSSNQRMIDVQKSLKHGETILYKIKGSV